MQYLRRSGKAFHSRVRCKSRHQLHQPQNRYRSQRKQRRSRCVLTIPGMHIDHPIAQAGNNEFYLYRDINGRLNQRLGCPFLDYRCQPDFSGFNTIVYKHHMTKQRMFADIALYQDLNFMAQCPEGTLEKVYRIRFFAYLTVPSDQLYLCVSGARGVLVGVLEEESET